ncbi:VOC family protein [Streptomyces collinus]|uniref:VOC family protein n=1 Tax=Streptomyces collinus TaxID=42684 RepID=UPI003325B13D
MTDTPRAGLHAYLSYHDAAAALEWLTATGFETTARQIGPSETIVHAEVCMGDVALMIASADRAYAVAPLHGVSSGSGLYLWMPDASDVDDWYRRAVAAGARGVITPENTPWGGRRARVLDPEGHEWSAGTYRPGLSW